MSPVSHAREKVGLSVDEAARSASISTDYLKRIERLGNCSFPLARRLARLYECSVNVFLLKSTNQSSQTLERSKKKTRTVATVRAKTNFEAKTIRK